MSKEEKSFEGLERQKEERKQEKKPREATGRGRLLRERNKN